MKKRLAFFWVCLPFSLLSLNAQQTKETYLTYLNNNVGDGSYADTLLKASLLENTTEASLQLLNRYVSGVTNPKGREKVYSHLASIYELSGNIEQAKTHYQKAYEVSRPQKPQYLLHLAYLQLEQGDTQPAINLATNLYRETLSQPSNHNLKNRILQLMFTVYTREKALDIGNKLASQEDLFISQSANAGLLWALYNFYFHLNQSNKANSTKAVLLKKYHSSPEVALLNGKARVYPSPMNLF